MALLWPKRIKFSQSLEQDLMIFSSLAESNVYNSVLDTITSTGNEMFWANSLAVSDARLAALLHTVKVGGISPPRFEKTLLASAIPLFVSGLSKSRNGISQLDLACRIRISFFITIIYNC